MTSLGIINLMTVNYAPLPIIPRIFLRLPRAGRASEHVDPGHDASTPSTSNSPIRYQNHSPTLPLSTAPAQTLPDIILAIDHVKRQKAKGKRKRKLAEARGGKKTLVLLSYFSP